MVKRYFPSCESIGSFARITDIGPKSGEELRMLKSAGFGGEILQKTGGMPEVVGADVYDRAGNEHLGITRFPVPVLKGNVEVIKTLREMLYEQELSDWTVVDFTDLAQGCKTYDEFIGKMKDALETELNYFGIAICGPEKKVNKLTGSMALLR